MVDDGTVGVAAVAVTVARPAEAAPVAGTVLEPSLLAFLVVASSGVGGVASRPCLPDVEMEFSLFIVLVERPGLLADNVVSGRRQYCEWTPTMLREDGP